MKIYTKTGDTGATGLLGGLRVSKDEPRIEAYGTVDELNAALGLVRTGDLPVHVDELLGKIQADLFAVGAALATPPNTASGARAVDKRWIEARHIDYLEQAIDLLEKNLPQLTSFILPTGTVAAAGAHLARAICRRAERRVVTLASEPDERINPDLIVFLNRLGDLLFVVCRTINQAAGKPDEPWHPE